MSTRWTETDITCNRCQFIIATRRPITKEVVLVDDDELGATSSLPIDLNQHVWLAAGYVLAPRKRHRYPWYRLKEQRRQDNRPQREVKVKLPVWVTCRCGDETSLVRDDNYANVPAEGLPDAITDVMLSRAEDDFEDGPGRARLQDAWERGVPFDP